MVLSSLCASIVRTLATPPNPFAKEPPGLGDTAPKGKSCHNFMANLGEITFFVSRSTGVTICPTQTMHAYKGNPSKLPHICILSFPRKWVIEWPLMEIIAAGEKIKDHISVLCFCSLFSDSEKSSLWLVTTNQYILHPPSFIAPEELPFQKESSLPTIIFQGLC